MPATLMTTNFAYQHCTREDRLVLEQWAQEIRGYSRHLADAAREIGRTLQKARERILSKTRFLAWAERQCGLNEPQTWSFIRVAETFPDQNLHQLTRSVVVYLAGEDIHPHEREAVIACAREGETPILLAEAKEIVREMRDEEEPELFEKPKAKSKPPRPQPQKPHYRLLAELAQIKRRAKELSGTEHFLKLCDAAIAEMNRLLEASR